MILRRRAFPHSHHKPLQLRRFTTGDAHLHPTTTRQYNESIKSLTRHRSTIHQALLLFPQIRLLGLQPDAYSFTFSLKAAAALSALKPGQQIHCQAIKVGFDLNLYTCTALVQMYASMGCMGSARKVFDEMLVRNVVVWTSLICGYVNVKRPMEGFGLFRRMIGEGIEPDEVAMTAVLSACSDVGLLEFGEWIHGVVIGNGIRRSVTYNNVVIDMYAKSGEIGRALEVFEGLESRNVVSWTTMISGLASNGGEMEALEMFRRMEEAGERPNEVTFLAVMCACNHAGYVELGRYYFRKMTDKYKISPEIKHYACFVDLLSRAGKVREAEEVAWTMPFEANAAVWGPILAAARRCGDAELAERVAGYLFSLEPKNSGNYLLLTNTYAAVGRWDEAACTRKHMRDSRVRARGSCEIEIDGEVHAFAACDTLHPRVEEAYDALQGIYRCLKVAGVDRIEDEEPVNLVF